MLPLRTKIDNSFSNDKTVTVHSPQLVLSINEAFTFSVTYKNTQMLAMCVLQAMEMLKQPKKYMVLLRVTQLEKLLTCHVKC